MLIKRFRDKKLQTALLFMLIMLCSMLLCASVSIMTSLKKPFEEFAKQCNSATAIVYPYSQKDSKVLALGEEFKKLSEVDRVEYVRLKHITEEITYKGKKIEGFIKLTEYNKNVYGQIRYIDGDKNFGASLKEDECIIPACISNKYNIKTGDKIKMKFDSKVISYTVKGIYSDAYNTSDAFDVDVLIKKLPETVTGYLNIKLYGKSGVTGEQIEEAYRNDHDGQMDGEMGTIEGVIKNSLLAGNIVAAIFLVISVVMLFTSCIIINFMIKNVMISDAKNIAVYKTVGYSSNDILKMYLTFYFIVVSLASILGIVISVHLSNTILSSVFKNMGQVVSNNVLLPGLLCYAVTVGFVILIIYIIINKAKNVKPVYALNGMSISSTKKVKLSSKGSKIQFSPLGIALRTIMRNKRNTLSIIITAIVTIFSINFGVISLDVANAMKDNNDYWLGVDKADVMVVVSDSKNYSKVENIIKQDPRISYYLRSNLGDKVSMRWKKGMISTTMDAFVYDDYSKVNLPIVKGRNPEASNEIAIASKAAEDLNKTVGDYIEVYLGKEKKVNLLITGIFQTYFQMGDACRLTKSAYTENNQDFSYDYISIYLKNPKEMKVFMEDIKKKINGDGNVMARTEVFSSIMDMIVAPQKNAVPPMVGLILIIGGINIFGIVLLKNASSEKINGIYKCLGYSTWHLILSNLYYVGIVAVASIIVAVPVIMLAYPDIMRLSLSMFNFLEYPVKYNYWHIILTNFIAFMTFIVSTIISSQSLRKVDVRDLVQE